MTTIVQHHQHPTLKKPVRPVLLQMPGSSDAQSGYARLAQTRPRTGISPAGTGALSKSLTMATNQAASSTSRHPKRAASLPPGRKRDTTAPLAHSRSQEQHGNVRLGNTSSKATGGLQQNTSDPRRRGSSTECRQVATTPEVLSSSVGPGTMRHLPGTGSYYGRGRFAPPASSPETLGM